MKRKDFSDYGFSSRSTRGNELHAADKGAQFGVVWVSAYRMPTTPIPSADGNQRRSIVIPQIVARPTEISRPRHDLRITNASPLISHQLEGIGVVGIRYAETPYHAERRAFIRGMKLRSHE